MIVRLSSILLHQFTEQLLIETLKHMIPFSSWRKGYCQRLESGVGPKKRKRLGLPSQARLALRSHAVYPTALQVLHQHTIWYPPPETARQLLCSLLGLRLSLSQSQALLFSNGSVSGFAKLQSTATQ
jgi:hypothetical protein